MRQAGIGSGDDGDGAGDFWDCEPRTADDDVQGSPEMATPATVTVKPVSGITVPAMLPEAHLSIDLDSLPQPGLLPVAGTRPKPARADHGAVGRLYANVVDPTGIRAVAGGHHRTAFWSEGTGRGCAVRYTRGQEFAAACGSRLTDRLVETDQEESEIGHGIPHQLTAANHRLRVRFAVCPPG